MANKLHQSVSLQHLKPTGWAPRPVGKGTPFKLPPLEITLPEEFTAPLALKHYEAMHNQLCQQVQAGGQDGVTIIINGWLTAQEPGQVKPTIINVSVCVHFAKLC
jgi:hypothetical protein